MLCQCFIHSFPDIYTWLTLLLCGGSDAKESPAMQEIWVQSLGQEDPLEKEMATHSSILAWRSLRAEEPGGLQSIWSQRAGHNWVTNISTVRYWTRDRMCTVMLYLCQPLTLIQVNTDIYIFFIIIYFFPLECNFHKHLLTTSSPGPRADLST